MDLAHPHFNALSTRIILPRFLSFFNKTVKYTVPFHNIWLCLWSSGQTPFRWPWGIIRGKPFKAASHRWASAILPISSTAQTPGGKTASSAPHRPCGLGSGRKVPPKEKKKKKPEATLPISFFTQYYEIIYIFKVFKSCYIRHGQNTDLSNT